MTRRGVRVAAWSGVALGATYLIWRPLGTLSGASPLLFTAVWLVEALAVVRLAVEVVLLVGPRAGPAPGGTADEGNPPPDPDEPVVDVVVLAVDEPVSEIRACLLAARLVAGRGEVLLAGSHERPEVAELCRRLSVPRHVAGGSLVTALGAALDAGRAPFVALVPADTVLLPDAMELARDRFDDPGVGVVLPDVEATNADNPIDHVGYGDHQVRRALVAPRLDAADALPWWPGPGIVRRRVLEEVDLGAVPACTTGVTVGLGMLVRAAGWRIRRLPTVTARRLADWDDRRQLHRQARDLHERLVALAHPALRSARGRLSRLERIAHLSAWVRPVAALRLVPITAVLVVVSFTSAVPITGSAGVVAAAWSGRVLSTFLARRLLLAPVGWRSWVAGDLRRGATDLDVALRAARLRALDVDVTDTPPGFHGRRVLAGVVVVASLVGGVGIGLGLVRTHQSDLVTFGALATAAWLVGAVVQARAALRLRQERRTFRTFGELPVLAAAGGTGLRVVGVSPFGLDVVSATPLRRGAKVRLALELPTVDGGSTRFETPGVVRRCSSGAGGHVAYVRFAQLDDDHADRIAEYCAVVAGLEAVRPRDGADRHATADPGGVGDTATADPAGDAVAS